MVAGWHPGRMNEPARLQRRYDHRLKELVRLTGDIRPVLEVGVPSSTARGWLQRSQAPIVSLPAAAEMLPEDLHRELVRLRRQNERLLAILRLVVALLRVSGYSLRRRRLSDGWKKALLLTVIEQSRSVLGLRSCLRVVRLSSSRYHSWRRESQCELDDVSSCPRTNPRQLTRAEVREIREMVVAEEFRHIPTGALSVLAQRLGRVFASPSTWYRLVRRHGWRRPRARVHPEKPTIGIRASKPNEIWHIDVLSTRTSC